MKTNHRLNRLNNSIKQSFICKAESQLKLDEY